MKYARCEIGGAIRCGLIDGNSLKLFATGVDSLVPVIEAWAAGAPAQTTVEETPLAEARLLAPLHPDKNVFCVGRNYMGHAEEIARARGTELKLPSVPTFFTKAPTAISGPGATVHFARRVSSEYDYEAELAVVIGKRCRDVSRERALDVVFGYTALNDLTARDLQREHGQWFKGKSLDEACPIGPWIAGADEVGDPQTLDISLRRNGQTKQSSSTSQMIFSVAAIIESLSAGLTLEPGDVIATGTPDGVGFARTPPEFLEDGDQLEVEIGRVGILRNSIALA